MDMKNQGEGPGFLYEIINYMYNSGSYYCKNTKYKK